jgi:hypothetical protein
MIAKIVETCNSCVFDYLDRKLKYAVIKELTRFLFPPNSLRRKSFALCQWLLQVSVVKMQKELRRMSRGWISNGRKQGMMEFISIHKVERMYDTKPTKASMNGEPTY